MESPLCGHRSQPVASVLATITKKTEKAKLRPEKSTFLALPIELWDEPGLLSNCLNCDEILNFNPFIPGESILLTDKLNEQPDS